MRRSPRRGNVPYQWVIRRQFIGTYLDSDNRSFDARATSSLRLNEIAPGVLHVVGGSHNSLLVEMADHLVMVDAPVSDEQSLWVMNAARQRFPGKPIRWLVLTHHHMDHAGGVRAIVADGAVLVVGAPAREHYRRLLAAPMSRNPDMKPVDFSQVPILEVPESHVMSDSRGRQVIAYAMQDNPHAKGLLMVYVPDAKLGFVTDVWTPGPPLPDKPNAALMSVVNTVKRAGIEPALCRRPRRRRRLRAARQARRAITIRGRSRKFGLRPRFRPALGGGLALRLLEHHPAAAPVDVDGVLRREAAFEDRFGERILDFGLDRALERPRAVDRVEADLGELADRARRRSRSRSPSSQGAPSAYCSWMRAIDLMWSSASAWNTTISSMRLTNSGRKWVFTSPITASFTTW